MLEVTFQLALEVVAYSECLEEHKKYVIARQILRSGTSIGANAREAQGAESKADFIHKLKIAYKEAEELTYWLDLSTYSKNYPDPTKPLIDLLESSKKLLGRIISTSKSRT
ncbi:four helix bundle protein [Mangrovimonas futianensis]|uniref:four helix bundle protein n=1 Tax=Mangrovimonas futianensis TaxID=2895523 RepID=UPI001E61BAF0|nr:four helix bundle protein [Mangrovimonas futianensis]MCF1423205.1 four helix bundle protein [Mangrovimonas futianensis]